MGRLITGAVLAAIAMFIWGFLYFAVNPLTQTVFQRAPDDAAAQAALLDNLPETGTYLIPGNMEDEAAFAELHEAGPIAFVHISREGRPVMSGSVLLYGFLHMLVTAFLLAWLLRMAAPGLTTYGARVGFVTLAGFTASFFTHVGAIVWWSLPPDWFLFAAVYDLTAWIVAGLVLAKFVGVARQTMESRI
ncbi:MAG: hypothetical protein ACREVN_00385 [Gammaproteobacteria bacterium]